jgi:hypothetical protein
MHERTLVSLIRKRCAELGLHHLALTTYRIPGANTAGPGPKGYPDFTIAGPGGVIFRECKAASRRSLAQIGWGRALAAAGADYAIWRPEDLESGRIEAELQALAGQAPGDSSTRP